MKRTMAVIGVALLAQVGCAIQSGPDESTGSSDDALVERTERSIVHTQKIDPVHSLTGATSVAHTGASQAMGPHVGPGDPVETN